FLLIFLKSFCGGVLRARVFCDYQQAQKKNGSLERMELSPQELRTWLSRLPCLWKSSWDYPEVWTDVLQAVFPQQCQGNWLHQVSLNVEKISHLRSGKFFVKDDG
ncbi:40S ribosomal protein S29, partial [Melia azedarach]